jgi:hypothetical protein
MSYAAPARAHGRGLAILGAATLKENTEASGRHPQREPARARPGFGPHARTRPSHQEQIEDKLSFFVLLSTRCCYGPTQPHRGQVGCWVIVHCIYIESTHTAQSRENGRRTDIPKPDIRPPCAGMIIHTIVDGWMDGWMDGWGSATYASWRIHYSNSTTHQLPNLAQSSCPI